MYNLLLSTRPIPPASAPEGHAVLHRTASSTSIGEGLARAQPVPRGWRPVVRSSAGWV